MGATTFSNTVKLPKDCRTNGTLPKEVKKAFADEVENAQYDYGHGGYSGTIAEKSSVRYVLHFKEADYELIEAFTEKRLRNNNQAGDKWGPAEAISFERNGELFVEFYGWASE